MLQIVTLPASWRMLLETLRPVFRRSSTFGLFALLATGLVARTARRTVVGMLAGVGMAAMVSFHSACRFFSHYAWDVDRLGLAVARLIVDRLLHADAAITVVVDDTLFRRWGKQVHHAFWTHDGAAQGPAKLGRGNRWVIAGIVVRLPFCSHPVCLPILFRLWAGKGTASPVELAGEMLIVLAESFPAQADPRSSATPPTTADRCWFPAPRSPPDCPPTPPCPPRRRRAPAAAADPPRKARSYLGSTDLAATATWRTVTVHRYGRIDTVHDRRDRLPVVRRVRRHPRPAGAGPRTRHHHRLRPRPVHHRPVTATPQRIVERYADRWTSNPPTPPASNCSASARPATGSARAVERTVPFGFLIQTLVIVWYALPRLPPRRPRRPPRRRALVRPQDRTLLRRHARQAPPHPHRRTIYRGYPKSARPQHNPRLRTGLRRSRRITAKVEHPQSRPDGRGRHAISCRSTPNRAARRVVPRCRPDASRTAAA